ncbi:FAD/NAD(P)-binding oxidoreductase, partial [Halomonas sp. 707D7]|uniref:NAD(P)/FAD-dependent oxidoreductase n=1 Tax=Halomonas sp. 707D7 TaxID=1681044 RepID=UPI0020A04900
LNCPPSSSRRSKSVTAWPRLATAVSAASRGHAVTLFERREELGGQFNYARKIPGKEEFFETLRYFHVMLAKYAVDVRLNAEATAEALADFDVVVIATGVTPRTLDVPGADHPSVLSYAEAIEHPERVGREVAVIGAGGIGFDVSELLSHVEHPALDLDAWCREWGVDLSVSERGGLVAPNPPAPARRITLLQRKRSKPGKGLGKTTGWVHRAALKARNVAMLSGCEYLRIDDDGLHLRMEGEERVLAVDSIVVCAGQESVRDLVEPLKHAGREVHVIGGAFEAAELDAKRAIDQGMRLAATL